MCGSLDIGQRVECGWTVIGDPFDAQGFVGWPVPGPMGVGFAAIGYLGHRGASMFGYQVIGVLKGGLPAIGVRLVSEAFTGAGACGNKDDGFEEAG